MKIKVGVIFGGETVEHEISVISAVQAMESMDKDKYDIVPIYITKDRVWYTGKMLMEIDSYKDMDLIKRYAKEINLVKIKKDFILQSVKGFKREIDRIDVAFPVVHGNNMEDGSVAGYLRLMNIPFIGSGIIGSALGQDKIVMKQVFESSDIPCVPYTWFYDVEYNQDSDRILKEINKIGYPVIVKPASLGSSVGIKVANNEENVKDAINYAISYDNKIVVEKAVKDLIEVNCSVLGNYETQEVSAIEEVIGTDEILSYRDKYEGGGKAKGMASAGRIVPARISDSMTQEIKDLSVKVFKTLNLSGVCRIDFLIDKSKNKVYVNEPNTCPGSLSFYLWSPVGKEYKELLDDMITLGIKEFNNRKNKTYSFDTNVLSNFNGLKGGKGKLKG